MATLTDEVGRSSCTTTELQDNALEMINLMPVMVFEHVPATAIPLIRAAVDRVIQELWWCGLTRRAESTVRECLKALVASTAGDQQRALIEAVVQRLEFDGNTTARSMAAELRAVQPAHSLNPDTDAEEPDSTI